MNGHSAQNYVLTVIKTIRRKPIKSKHQMVPQGVPPPKLYGHVRFSNHNPSQHCSALHQLIEASTITFFGHAVRYFGTGERGYHCRCIIKGLDIPSWYEFTKDNYAMTPEGKPFDETTILSGQPYGYRRDVLRQYNFVHFTQLRLYVTEDGLTEEVKNAVMRERHPLRPHERTLLETIQAMKEL